LKSTNMKNPLESEGEFQMSLSNPNPTSSKTKHGPVYRVSFELTQDEWQQFMDCETMGMVIECVGRVTHRNDQVGTAEDGFSFEQCRKPEKGPYGQEAKALVLSGFFTAPTVWKAIGTDEEFREWIQQQPCIVCKDKDWVEKLGEGRCEAAHVLRAGGKPSRKGKRPNVPAYACVPMTHKCHKEIQHPKGELAAYMMALEIRGKLDHDNPPDLQAAKTWFDKMRIQHVEQWAKQELKALLDYESLTEIPPSELYTWATENSVENYMPKEYRSLRYG